MRRISSSTELDALYGPPVASSLSKVADHMTPLYRRWVEAARFCVVCTAGPNGTHGTPRGDIDPVVRVADPKTLHLPDWKGNNRLDALRDLIEDPRIAFIFMIPGTKTTVRVNGTAFITDDADLRASFEKKGKQPATVIVTEICEVYTQCAKALMRSGLWDGAPVPDGLPTVGDILADMTNGEVGGSDYDTHYEERAQPRMW
ncbi:pyridoxamine 5'-phosphate oxidase family protein [Marivita sp. S6314]|uniref:pyridoxamine 5'-phosphate oxidase family protein n=1 Tax=Marivita sp. S6314 TaxID=2926406 RepID=UPI001FF155D5|nr:pyridoxamine 5'-phosphate oxidase family protein [Marivita sp. S6314]MCK0150543.1 pyridoxamine 5'-phosphate oxidase family protein [Marivita sp. S6314]